MGFSIGCSLGSHVLVRNTGKFPPSCRKERLNLSTVCSEFNKPCKIRVSLCKSELVDFDERTSPTEVIPLSNCSLVHFSSTSVLLLLEGLWPFSLCHLLVYCKCLINL